MKKIFSALTIILSASSLFSQANNELYNNGALIHISTGAEVHVLGDVHMRGATGMLSHYGLLKVDGNMYGDNLFQQRGTGTTRIQNNLVNSGQAQKISGSYAVRGTSSSMTGVDDGSFYNLELANDQGIVWLETNAIAGSTPYVADVRNAVDFLYGPVNNRIITHNPAILPANGSGYSAVFGVMNPTAGLASMIDNTVTLYGNMSNVDVGYVQGKLRRVINPAGGIYGYVLGLEPAGAGMQRGMQYMHMNFGPNTYDVLEGYFETGLDNTFASQLECSGYMIDYWGGIDHGQWIVNSPNGGSGTYSMTVWCQDDNFPAKTVWLITKDNAIAGTPDECGPSPVNLTRSAFNGFSSFGVAASEVTILPVDLIKIWAESKTDHIEVNWLIGSEQDVSHYNLERSLDGSNFDYLTTIAAVGNSSSTLNYSYDDFEVLRETNYFYRYKVFDNDGSYEFSPVVVGRLYGEGNGNLNESVFVYPNPSESNFNLGIYSDGEKAIQIQIYNTIGQLVYNEQQNLSKGYNVFPVSADEWAVGMYNLKIQDLSSDENVWKKIIKN